MFSKFVLSFLIILGVTPKIVEAEVLFNGDWANIGNLQLIQPYTWQNSGINNSSRWQNIQTNDLSRITLEKNPSRPNDKTVAHITVLPGDDLGYPGGERVEVSNMVTFDPVLKKFTHLDVLRNTPKEFYAISVKVPVGWKSPGPRGGNGPTWGSIMQLHSPNVLNSPPALSLSLTDKFYLDLCTGKFLTNGLRKNSVPYSFNAGTDGLNPGKWVWFVIEVKWATDSGGSIKVYRRDEDQKSWTTVLYLPRVPTLQFPVIPEELTQIEIKSPHYWKTGYYRSATPGLKSELWLGPLVRATSFADVAGAAFWSPN